MTEFNELEHMDRKMEVSEPEQDMENSSPIIMNHATVATLAIPGGMFIIAVVVIVPWKSLIIAPLVDVLLSVYRLTGNLRISILILSIGIHGLSLLVRALTLRVERNMWELDPGGQELRRRRAENFTALLSGCLRGIWQGLVAVSSVAMIWVFWFVFLPRPVLVSEGVPAVRVKEQENL